MARDDAIAEGGLFTFAGPSASKFDCSGNRNSMGTTVARPLIEGQSLQIGRNVEPRVKRVPVAQMLQLTSTIRRARALPGNENEPTGGSVTTRSLDLMADCGKVI